MKLNSITNDDNSSAIANSLSTQIQLNKFYLRELGEPKNYSTYPKSYEYYDIHNIENIWNSFEESLIDITTLPNNHSEFINWYKSLHSLHTKKISSFFNWLSNEATLEELGFYISMEEQVDGRFDDVIALAQLGLTGDVKLALAENYWDEMGRGEEAEMHTFLFNESAKKLSELLGSEVLISKPPVEAIKNGNLLLMYSLRRQYHPRLLGALAILEHTAPYRFSKTVKAMQRLNLSDDIIYYHKMHIEIDANHGKQLLHRVLLPLIKKNPEIIKEICIGCLVRYNIAIEYYKSIKTSIL